MASSSSSDCDGLYWFRPLDFHEIANRLPIFSTGFRCQCRFHLVPPSSDSDVLEISVVLSPVFRGLLLQCHEVMCICLSSTSARGNFLRTSSFVMALQRRIRSACAMMVSSSRAIFVFISRILLRAFAMRRVVAVSGCRSAEHRVAAATSLSTNFGSRPRPRSPAGPCPPPHLCTTIPGSPPQLYGRFATPFPHLLAYARPPDCVCTVTRSVDLHFPALPPTVDASQLGRPPVAGSRYISSSGQPRET